MYGRILLPTDGSDFATRGVDHGLALAKAFDIPVTVITVDVPLSGFALESVVQGEAYDSYNRAVEENAADLEAKIRAKATAAGVAMEFVSEVNMSAASAIIEAAEARKCGLIVIASHGRRGISRLMLGSQTAEVLAHSKVPVLVV